MQHLPENLEDWYKQRGEHLEQHLEYSQHSADLFLQYKKHLGSLRFFILKEVQNHLAPKEVSRLLHFRKFSIVPPLLSLYKISKRIKLDWVMRALLLPSQYKEQIRAIEKGA
jgi:hypothetical protein